MLLKCTRERRKCEDGALQVMRKYTAAVAKVARYGTLRTTSGINSDMQSNEATRSH
jgi:hypothetical protein